MKSFGRADFFVLGLALLAVLQFSDLVSPQESSAPPSTSWMEVGDTVSLIQAFEPGGRQVPLVTGQPAVILVFRSDCGHCRSVAPLWRDWIEEAGHSLRVVAVTSEPHDQARTFVSEHGLEVEVLTVAEGPRGGLAHALTARTPWVFFVDGSGSILAQGHGAEIGEMGAALIGRPAEVAVR